MVLLAVIAVGIGSLWLLSRGRPAADLFVEECEHQADPVPPETPDAASAPEPPEDTDDAPVGKQ